MELTTPALGPGQAHLWRRSLAPDRERLAALAATLAADERDRATALRAPLARDRFIAARGLLRETLGAYTATPPAAVRLCAGPHGKPHLAGEQGGLRFNLSHCDDLLLIAVARGREVGVDVERVRPIVAMGQIAASLLTAEEREALRRVAPEERDRLFARIWTRHEARAKGHGGGLAQAAAVDGDWTLFELSPCAGYAAALALDGLGWRACPAPEATAEPWARFSRHEPRLHAS